MKILPVELYVGSAWPKVLTSFVIYIVISLATPLLLPPLAGLYPAYSLALIILYFYGLRFWPLLFLATWGIEIIVPSQAHTRLLLPLVTTLQAIIGAWLLHKTHTDPLFRRYRDMFYFFVIVLGISSLAPTGTFLFHTIGFVSDPPMSWGYEYVATLVCFLILTPFLLRWITKPRFKRTTWEVFETLTVFCLLIAIDAALFIEGIERVFDIPLVYTLSIPLFVIALRLRPRFLTLALLITSLYAIAGALITADGQMLTQRLFDTELFLIAFATAFFIVVSLEEDRRVNTNVMHSQLATLNNVVAQTTHESKAKNDFIAILAHELRNPLAPIVSSIDFLKMKGGKDADELATLEMMEVNMHTVRRLLDDLLDTSRISEGKMVIEKKVVDMQSVLKRSLMSTHHHRKERHQSLILKIPETPVYVLGDAVRLEQVFSNLLTNASKYSESGTAIRVFLRTRRDQVEVEIADEGVGLQPEVLETIFIPYRQIEHGEQSKKGLGIGLALVRSFIELHGGSVKATSGGKGLGSSFIVRLPIQEASVSVDNKGGRIKTEIVQGTRTKKPLILIAEANDAVAGGMGRFFESHGCRVEYTYDGAMTVKKGLSLSPQMILLSMDLPDQDGYGLARQLRTRGFQGRLIALIEAGGKEGERRAVSAGFDQSFVKPLPTHQLQALLQKVA